ncbi:hypothetical protein [Bosea massiliensis]|jgi:hypothetical protein|uniref:Transglutaminase-like domain-containing protein n=1 Tax=Bosea massiliensis TaxID=151419 RepID=A0ABW0P5W7_9HYPH
MTLARLDEHNATNAPHKSDHAIARLIAHAAFDEHDLDIATSGLCGTFALALLDTLRERGIAAAGVVAYIGEPSTNVKRIEWRHALIETEGRLFDVEGEVERADVLENYCWGRTNKPCGFQSLDDVAFRALIVRTRNSYDRRWYADWAEALRLAARHVR